MHCCAMRVLASCSQRELEIGFDIAGTFCGTRISMTKQHRGRYRNSVTYEGRVLRDPTTGLYAMTGSYEHGRFSLQQICNEDGVDGGGGGGGGAASAEVHGVDALAVAAQASDAGPARERSAACEQIATSPSAAPPSSSSPASSSSSSSEPCVDDGDGGCDGGGAGATRTGAISEHLAMEYLCGLWEGCSTDSEEHCTLWKETFLQCQQVSE